jgi:hypothetical protein
VNFEEVKVGRIYGVAARARRKAAELPTRARALDKVNHKDWHKRRVKVQYLDGRIEGLEEWVPTSRILAPWSDVKAIIRDEQRGQHLLELGQEYDEVVLDAIDIVLQSTGEEDLHSPDRGALSIPGPRVAGLRRVAERAGFMESADIRSVRDAFIDRRGTAHYPIAYVEKLVRAFASAEPETVTRHIELEERKLKAEGYLPGESFSHHWLEKQQPGFALARSWAGFENEVRVLREQIERLVGVCEMAAAALVAAGQDAEARRIRRALRGL